MENGEDEDEGTAEDWQAKSERRVRMDRIRVDGGWRMENGEDEDEGKVEDWHGNMRGGLRMDRTRLMGRLRMDRVRVRDRWTEIIQGMLEDGQGETEGG